MAVPELVVVLLCVIGAGAVVVAISAFGRQFLWKHEVEDTVRDWNQVPPAQASYMKWVREWNQMALIAVVQKHRAQVRYSGTARTGGDSESISYHAHGYGYGDEYAYGDGGYEDGKSRGDENDYGYGHGYAYGKSESAGGRGSSNTYYGRNSGGYVGYEEGPSRHHAGYEYTVRTG